MACDEPGHQHAPIACGMCGNAVWVIEAGITMHQAARIIPMTLGGLKQHLSRHRDVFPARYRLDRVHRRHRILYSGELQRIRRDIFRGTV
jgi:hypothetical protein